MGEEGGKLKHYLDVVDLCKSSHINVDEKSYIFS